MSHLGSQISALADGQLPPAAAERAMAHVASCGDCAVELAAARAARQVLAAAFDVPVTPELTERLLALGAGRQPSAPAASLPPAPRTPAIGGQSIPLPGTASPRRMPQACLHGDLSGARRVHQRFMVAAMAGVGVVAAALFALGDLPAVVPASHPAEALTVLGRAGDAAQEDETRRRGDATILQAVLPWSRPTADLTDRTDPTGSTGSTDQGGPESFGPPPVELDLAGDDAHERVSAWMAANGWGPLETLPAGYRVTAVRTATGTRTLEVDLDGPAGLVVLTLEHGRLDPDVPQRAAVPVGEGEVHVLSTVPWHGVWQAQDTVVSVVAEVPSEALLSVLESYPAQPYDDGVAARIARGWAVLGAWSL